MVQNKKTGEGGNYSIHWGKGVEYFGYIYVMGNCDFYVIKKKHFRCSGMHFYSMFFPRFLKQLRGS